jgi:hypothetical protein
MTQGTQKGIGNAQPAPDTPLQDVNTKTVLFERSRHITITFAPHTTTVIELTLKTKGVPYWSRPDLGIDPEDVKVEGSHINVTVHSVGAVDAPASKVILRNRDGKIIATADVPAIMAPLDLKPKTANAVITIPANADLKGATVAVECGGDVPEITLLNNSVDL